MQPEAHRRLELFLHLGSPLWIKRLSNNLFSLAKPLAAKRSLRMGTYLRMLVLWWRLADSSDWDLGPAGSLLPLNQVVYSCPHTFREEVHRRDSIL